MRLSFFDLIFRIFSYFMKQAKKFLNISTNLSRGLCICGVFCPKTNTNDLYIGKTTKYCCMMRTVISFIPHSFPYICFFCSSPFFVIFFPLNCARILFRLFFPAILTFFYPPIFACTPGDTFPVNIRYHISQA